MKMESLTIVKINVVPSQRAVFRITCSHVHFLYNIYVLLGSSRPYPWLIVEVKNWCN